MTKPKLEDFPHPQGGYSTLSFHNALIAWQEGELTQLRGNLSLAEEGLANYALEVQRLTTVKANLMNALAAKQAKIDALMLEFCPGEMSAQQKAEWAAHQVTSDEPLQQQSGVDFDKDLARLDGIRKTMVDMRRYSLQGVPQDEVEFLLAFIDNLWREYSRAIASPPLREEGPAALVGALQDVIHTDTGAVRAGHAVKSEGGL